MLDQAIRPFLGFPPPHHYLPNNQQAAALSYAGPLGSPMTTAAACCGSPALSPKAWSSHTHFNTLPLDFCLSQPQ